MVRHIAAGVLSGNCSNSAAKASLINQEMGESMMKARVKQTVSLLFGGGGRFAAAGRLLCKVPCRT